MHVIDSLCCCAEWMSFYTHLCFAHGCDEIFKVIGVLKLFLGYEMIELTQLARNQIGLQITHHK